MVARQIRSHISSRLREFNRVHGNPTGKHISSSVNRQRARATPSQLGGVPAPPVSARTSGLGSPEREGRGATPAGSLQGMAATGAQPGKGNGGTKVLNRHPQTQSARL